MELGAEGRGKETDKAREISLSQLGWLLESNQGCLQFKISGFEDNRFEM